MTENKQVQETEEAVYKEVDSTVEEKETGKPVRCAITAGMTEDGGLFVQLHGSEQHLVILEGLLEYANRHVDELWEKGLSNNSRQEG